MFGSFESRRQKMHTKKWHKHYPNVLIPWSFFPKQNYPISNNCVVIILKCNIWKFSQLKCKLLHSEKDYIQFYIQKSEKSPKIWQNIIFAEKIGIVQKIGKYRNKIGTLRPAKKLAHHKRKYLTQISRVCVRLHS
jgi:hypothetical protein